MHFSDESRLGSTFIWGLFTLEICMRSIDVTYVYQKEVDGETCYTYRGRVLLQIKTKTNETQKEPRTSMEESRFHFSFFTGFCFFSDIC